MDFCDDKNKIYMNVISKKNEDIKKCKKDNGSNYILLPSSQKYEKENYSGEKDRYRLEIEGENTDNPEKKYVNLQLQQYSGQNNAYACIFAPADFSIHVNHMYFALNLAVYKYTSQKLVSKLKGEKLENYIGVAAEKMKGFRRDKANPHPDIVYLDDTVFMATRRKDKKTDANTL